MEGCDCGAWKPAWNLQWELSKNALPAAALLMYFHVHNLEVSVQKWNPPRAKLSYTYSPKNHNPNKRINSTWEHKWYLHSFHDSSVFFVLSLGLLPSASSVDCVFLDLFSKGSNFTDLQIIWHTQIRCLLCICLVNFYLLFLPSFGCPYFCNIWPILWGNMVLLIADACESWDSVPISAGELWEIFEKLPMFWVFPEDSSDGGNSWVLMSADTSVLVQIRRTLWKCVSQPSSFVCVAGWSLEHGICFSFGCYRTGAGRLWFLDPAAHQT